MDEKPQSGLLPQSGAARGPSAVDTTCCPRTRGRHPDTGSGAVHRRPASHRRLSRRRSVGRIGTETHIVDLARTRSTMFCCFRTGPTTFIWTSRRTARHRYGILLLATDAARRPGLNVVCAATGRLFQQ